MTTTDSVTPQILGLAWRGSFTIDERDHARFCAAVFAPDWQGPFAHPVFLHLVAHCGKGVELADFFAAIGTSLEAGVTFGEGRLESLRPLVVGATYAVSTVVVDVLRKSGRRGAFDVVTCRIEVRDDADRLCGLSTESFIVPRSAHA